MNPTPEKPPAAAAEMDDLQPRRERLQRADEALAKVKLYLRLASKWGWQTEDQHRHAAGIAVEIGRLLGGWHKATGGPPVRPAEA